MGVLSDLLANADTFQTTDHRIAGDRVTYRQLKDILNEHGDFDYPSGYSQQNEVQSIAIYGGTVSAGTPTLAFTLKSGQTFTTAAFAFNAVAATIQTAINVAATSASITGWTNGDIVVTGGPLTTTPLTLTFSGTSVAAKNHSPVVIAGTLTGGTVGAVSTSTSGQPTRTAWAALKALGLISTDAPAHGANLTSATAVFSRGHFPYKLNNDTVRALVEEAAHDDANDTVSTVLLAALGF